MAQIERFDEAIEQRRGVVLQPARIAAQPQMEIGALAIEIGRQRFVQGFAEWRDERFFVGFLDLAQPSCDQPQSADAEARSEEHTSELQSLMRISYAVFCLKKKKQK